MSYDYIILSPHFDDAVLSCAGFITKKTKEDDSVLIITVFAGIPKKPYTEIAEYFHTRWEILDDPVKTRRAEDVKACNTLKTDLMHLEYLDCIYRKDSDGNALLNQHEDLFKGLSDSELELTSTIAKELKKRCLSTKVLVPICLGSHRDHKIVRKAAENADLNIHAYYEEYPYWARKDRDHRISEPDGFEKKEIKLNENTCLLKKKAINCYEHPIKSLFGSNTIEESTEDSAKQVCLEKSWFRI